MTKLLDRLFNRPLMVTDQAVDAVLAALSLRREERGQSGLTLEGEEFTQEMRLGEPARDVPREYSVGSNRTAYIPVMGKLVHNPLAINSSSGMQPYTGVTAMAEEAQHDDAVDRLAYVFDTPGGTSAGVFEAAEYVYGLRGLKPAIAIVNEMAASAGYLLASAVGPIVLNTEGRVGSIGVIARMRNSTSDNIEVLRTVPNKARSVGGMSDEDRDHLMGEMQQLHTRFVNRVAKYRDMEPGDVDSLQGDIITGTKAVKEGFADKIRSVNTTIALGAIEKKETLEDTRMNEELMKLCQAFGISLEDDATDEEASEAIADYVNDLNAASGETETQDEDIEELLASLDVKSLPAALLRVDNLVPAEELADAKKERLEAEATLFVNSLLADKKITAAKTDWARRKYMADPERFEELMEDMPAVVPDNKALDIEPGTKGDDDVENDAMSDDAPLTEAEKKHFRDEGYSEDEIAAIDA